MDNLFDTDNYPESEPLRAVVGDRLGWKRPDITDAYPTTAYTLKYEFHLQSEGATTPETVTASKDSSEHVVTIDSATTGGYTAGEYEWRAIIVRDSDSEEIVVDRGYLTFRDDSGDLRSHNYVVLQKIRSVIEGTASKEDQSYSVAGRSLSRRSMSELIELESLYARRWADELAETDRENGRTRRNTRVFVKMDA